MSTRWWWWAGLVALALPFFGACGSDEEAIEIKGFGIERAEPPLDPTGRLPTVAPGSTVHLSWTLRGRPERLILTANDQPLASWPGGQLPASFADVCGEGFCGSDTLGEVTYRLVAIRGGREVSRPLTMRVAEEGLRVLSFTSRLVSDRPTPVVELNWTTGGATAVRLTATPIGGGEERDLGRFSGKDTASGHLVDEGLTESTVYRLEATGLRGARVTAEIPVALGDEAFITSFSAAPPAVAPGEETTLSWQTSGLERLLLVRDDGGSPLPEIRREEVAEGSRNVTLMKEATFILVGVSQSGEVITELCDGSGCRPARLTVGLRPSPQIVDFRVEQRELTFGSTTRLIWDVQHAEEVIISWADASGDHERRSDQAAGSLEIQPGQSTRYNLVANGGGRVASRTASVTVRPAASLVAAVDPVYGGAYAGETLSVSWTTAGASLLDLSANGTAIPLGNGNPAAGTVSLPIPAEATEGSVLALELNARNDETPRKSTRVVLPVTLHRKPRFEKISFTPERIARGQTSLLEWKTVDAVGVFLTPPAPTRTGVEPWIELGAGDPEAGAAEIPLPFPWNGFEALRIHTEGWLSFGTAADLEAIVGGAAVAPFKGALSLQEGGSVRWRAGADRVIVQWTKLTRRGHAGDDLTFQAILRNDGNVQVGWKTLRLVDGANASAVGTVGVARDIPSVGPSVLVWNDGIPEGPREGSALIFYAGLLPANGALEVAPLSTWQPQAWAAAPAAPPAWVLPESLQVDPPQDR